MGVKIHTCTGNAVKSSLSVDCPAVDGGRGRCEIAVTTGNGVNQESLIAEREPRSSSICASLVNDLYTRKLSALSLTSAKRAFSIA